MYYVFVNKDNLKKKKIERKFNLVRKVFDKAGLEFTVIQTDGKDEVRQAAAEVTGGKGNTIVVMGGDGTLHDVLNGFIDFENNSLAIIPVGTGNDFAKSARIPKNAKKAAKIIADGKLRNVDFIQLGSGLRSLNAVGMGIDVDVLKRAYAGKNSKKSKYVHNLIVSLAKFESYNFTVRYNGKEEKHFGLIAAVGNGRQFGGGIKLFPKARICDGLLNLVIVDYISKIATIGAFIKLMLGRVNSIRQVTAVTAEAVEFIPDGDDFTIEADGELYDKVPFSAQIVKNKLKLYTNI